MNADEYIMDALSAAGIDAWRCSDRYEIITAHARAVPADTSGAILITTSTGRAIVPNAAAAVQYIFCANVTPEPFMPEPLPSARPVWGSLVPTLLALVFVSGWLAVLPLAL